MALYVMATRLAAARSPHLSGGGECSRWTTCWSLELSGCATPPRNERGYAVGRLDPNIRPCPH